MADSKDDSLSGAYYKLLVSNAIMVLENFWDRFWPFRVAKKRRAARHVQRLWRGFVGKRTYQPVFAFRDWRVQKWLRAHLLEWRSYSRKIVQARKFLLELFHAHEKWTLQTWRKAAVMQREEREQLLEMIRQRFQMRHVFQVNRNGAASSS